MSPFQWRMPETFPDLTAQLSPEIKDTALLLYQHLRCVAKFNSVSQIALNFISEFFLLKTILSSEMAVAAQHIISQRRPFHKFFKYSDQYLFALCL